VAKDGVKKSLVPNWSLPRAIGKFFNGIRKKYPEVHNAVKSRITAIKPAAPAKISPRTPYPQKGVREAAGYDDKYSTTYGSTELLLSYTASSYSDTVDNAKFETVQPSESNHLCALWKEIKQRLDYDQANLKARIRSIGGFKDVFLPPLPPRKGLQR